MRRSILYQSIFLLVLWCPIETLYAQSRETINLWYAAGELDAVLPEIAEQYSAQNRAVQINLVSLPNEELKTSIVRTVSNNIAPDIAIFSSDNTAYADLMQLSQFSVNQLEPLWGADEINAMQYAGKLYGLPLQRNNRLFMFYNKALVNHPAKTWRQLQQEAPDLVAQDILPVGMLFREPYWFAHFATLFTPQFVKGDKPALNSVGMADALEFFRQLAESGIVRDDCGYDCVSTDFYNGKVAYAMNGTWAISEAMVALGDDFGIVEFPSLDEIPMKALTSNVFLTFPNDAWNGANRTAVRAFSTYLRTKPVQIQIAEATGMLPINLEWVNEINQPEIHRTQINLSHEAEFMPAKLSYIAIWNALRKGMLLHHSRQLNGLDTGEYMQRAALNSQQRMMELDHLR